MRKLAVLAIVVPIVLSFCACSSYSQGGYEFDPGETVAIDDLDSIFDSQKGEQEGQPNTSNSEQSKVDTAPSSESTVAIVIDDNTVVYWTKSGTKYHIFQDCQSLKQSTNVSSGTLAKAKENKKNECCKHCESKAGISESNE